MLQDKYIGREKITLESSFEEAEAACGERSAWKEVIVTHVSEP